MRDNGVDKVSPAALSHSSEDPAYIQTAPLENSMWAGDQVKKNRESANR